MSKWDSLKERLRESNRDLDAEFEQFLNEVCTRSFRPIL
jgi:hypothetical protein